MLPLFLKSTDNLVLYYNFINSGMTNLKFVITQQGL